MHGDHIRAVNAAMEKPIRLLATRRHLLRYALTAGCGVMLAAFPASLRQESGAWPFAPAMALADDDRRDDDRDDREDDREDREDDRDDREDDRDDREDDDNSGPGNGDDDDDDDDNSGPGSGGDDDDNDGGGDNSGPGNGGDDNNDGGGTRYDDDDDDDNSDRPSTNRRIRDITVQYQDGWIERIVDGQYELIDNLNRRVILRPATIEDFNRMMALG
jgi:hypothetical protein